MADDPLEPHDPQAPEEPAFFAEGSPEPRPPLAESDATIFAFRRNIVVAASAGTGKTHRLTALYLLLALGLTSRGEADDFTVAAPLAPDRIIATTFSRAAALEISLRIERALVDFASWDGEKALSFAPVLRAREAVLGRRLSLGEIRKRAGEALARWSSAKIDTLHGVARRIVQRHALALGLPPGARVLDEEEAQSLSDLAVDEALGAALTSGGERAETARRLLTSAGGVGSARRQVQRLLDRLDEEGLTPGDLAIADHEGDARALARALGRVARESAALGSAVFREPASIVAAALAPDADVTSGPILPERAVPGLLALMTQRMPARSKRTPADDALDDFFGELPGKSKADRAQALISLLEHAPELAARERRLVELLEDARSRLGAAKRRAGGLGFGDLLRIARDAVRDRPEIARAVRETLDVLMVDEFQDTSRVQRDLVYLLREDEAAAAERPAGVSPRPEGLIGHGLFLVGDRKQSIYGFRGADVAVFSQVAAELSGRAAGEALAIPGDDWPASPVADFVALRESRRSGAAILSFVNAFSERDFAEDRPPGTPPRDFEIAYGPAEHLVPAVDPPAPDSAAITLPRPAEVVLVTDDGSSPESADPIVRESSGAAREAHVAAAWISELIAARGLGAVAFDERPVRWQDIAVLARRRSSIPLIELALGRLEIPYVVAGRALYDAPEVRDVAALLRLLLDPRDRLALATVLRGPMVALSETSLAELSLPGRGLAVPLIGRWPQPRPGEPPESVVHPSALDPAEKIRLEAFRARYNEVRRAALRLTPGEAIRAAVAAFDLDRILAALPRSEARIGNLDRLVNIARRRGGTLAGFVRWLDRRIRDEADEAEAAVFSPEDDAVRLTTIHASKGLDFPVVVLVDLNAEPRADHGGIGFFAGSRAAPGQIAGRAPTIVVRHYAPRSPRAAGGGSAGESVLFPITTGAVRAAQAEGRAREQAERRRLTYVAITRPKDTLVLIGSAAPPRHGSAFRSLTAAITEGTIGAALTATLEAKELLARARPAPARLLVHAPPEARAPARPARSPARALQIAAAPLGVFHDCPRRYRLRYLLGIEEPAVAGPQLDLFTPAETPEPVGDLPPPIDLDQGAEPRLRSRAAHRVIARWPFERLGEPTSLREVTSRLAAEGLSAESPSNVGGGAAAAQAARAVAIFLGSAFAARLHAPGTSVRRDHPFVLRVETGTRGVQRLGLRGAIDLLIERPGGDLEVLELAMARPRTDLAAYAFTLRAAALAAAQLAPERRIRAGVLFLDGGGEPAWLGPTSAEDLRRFEEELGQAAQGFAEARYHDRFEGVAAAICRKLSCGFVEACHGEKKGR